MFVKNLNSINNIVISFLHEQSMTNHHGNGLSLLHHWEFALPWALNTPASSIKRIQSFPTKTRDCPAAKGDEPTGINAQAYAMKEAVRCFGPANRRRGERQREMKSHSGQRRNADYSVPNRNYASGSAIQ
jgi:hypothetical protein